MIRFRTRIFLSIGLSVCFILIYGGTERFTLCRNTIPAPSYEWESRLPFVPLAIIPYLSIDLFYAIAPLLISRRQQVCVYCARITTALVAAAFIFILCPMRFGFERPHLAGLMGEITQAFWQVDLPYNQLPSLHIALLVILSDVYLTRLRGVSRFLLAGWFICIGISPVFVYQHHVIDVAAGLALGLICRVAVPRKAASPFERNMRIGVYYLAGTAVMIGICTLSGRYSWPIWWPTFSLLLVTLGYFSLGPSLYCKHRGRLGSIAYWSLWPVLVGQRLSLWWYSRRSQPFNRLTEHLWIGRVLSNPMAKNIVEQGVIAVIDLTAEFNAPSCFAKLSYLQIPVMDLTAPTPGQIDRALRFIAQHENEGITFVHCKVGYSRTAVIAGAYLLHSGRASCVESAVSMLKSARPGLIVRPEAYRALQRFHRSVVNRQMVNPQSAEIDFPTVCTSVESAVNVETADNAAASSASMDRCL